MDDLICEIRSLLELGYEGGYWDFKSDYPDKNKKEDKLHDIICMANNLEDRDAYLIYGANDDGTIKGIQNTEKQGLKTADFIKFLRDKNFAGGFIPDIKLQTIVIDNNELDILIIRRGKHTPYYLQKDYYESSPKEKLRAGAIYTRTADINTPKEQIEAATIEVKRIEEENERILDKAGCRSESELYAKQQAYDKNWSLCNTLAERNRSIKEECEGITLEYAQLFRGAEGVLNSEGFGNNKQVDDIAEKKAKAILKDMHGKDFSEYGFRDACIKAEMKLQNVDKDRSYERGIRIR